MKKSEQCVNAPAVGGVANRDVHNHNATQVGSVQGNVVIVHQLPPLPWRPARGPVADLLNRMPPACHAQLLHIIDAGEVALCDLAQSCRNHALVSKRGQLVQRGAVFSLVSAVVLLLMMAFPLYVSSVAWGGASWRWSAAEQMGLLFYTLAAALTPLGIFYFLVWPQVTAMRALQALRRPRDACEGGA